MDDRHINGGFLPHDRISENNHGMDENIRGDDVTMNQQATDDITVDTGQGYGITVGKGMGCDDTKERKLLTSRTTDSYCPRCGFGR